MQCAWLMDRYVVIGNPIAHSLSPDIHARFGEQTGDRIAYDRLLVEPGRFADAAREFFAAGGRGANVTLPFKLDAIAFAQSSSPRARQAGAANFLALREGAVFADNTDGAGLVNDLERNAGFALRGADVLLLGAGGATRGVLGPLLAAGTASITIANRTVARALELAGAFAGEGNVKGCALGDIAGRYDLVINATSASTRGEALQFPAGLFRSGALAYVMAYGQAAGPFLTQARREGAAVRDGLGMLVEQAAESFFLWRGTRPETTAVLAQLRARHP
jgi:shikimate dehydrogenase